MAVTGIARGLVMNFAAIFADGPIFAAAFAPVDSSTQPLVLYSGGGGSAKTGVSNFIAAAKVVEDGSGSTSISAVQSCDTGVECCSAITLARAKNGKLVAAGAFSAKVRLITVVPTERDGETTATIELAGDAIVADEKNIGRDLTSEMIRGKPEQPGKEPAKVSACVRAPPAKPPLLALAARR